MPVGVMFFCSDVPKIRENRETLFSPLASVRFVLPTCGLEPTTHIPDIAMRTCYRCAILTYTEDAGCAITSIPMKFGTVHGTSRPEVGSTKHNDTNGKKGVSLFSRIFDTSEQKTPAGILRSKTKLVRAY